VGNVTGTGKPRIALDTGKDAVFFNNPNLPDTRSEMALPLTARGEVIGALDVQSTIPNAFLEADISILSLLADQISIAIDNVRLIGETQNALAESQAILTEYVSESWRKRFGSGVLGYHQSVTGGKVITDPNTLEQVSANAGSDQLIEVPIRVREQVIGVLNIRAATSERDLRPDDMNIVNAVVERLGLALDNARLFEETSSRASRERLVTDITTKIRGSNDPEEMIKTAVEELKQALGVSRVEILPKKINPSPDV
jgi:GAF domain-containing protein